MAEREHCRYLDYLRILSALAVVCIHTSCQFFGNDQLPLAPIGSADWNAAVVYDSLSRFCVPVFLMISGALFLGRDVPIKKIYGKYILRILTAYIFWSFLYALLEGGGAAKILVTTINGGPRFSFLCYLIGLYMLTPLLDRIVRQTDTTVYFLVLCIVFGFLEPQLYSFLSNENIHIISTAAVTIHDFISRMRLTGLMWIPSYYILGYAIAHYDIKLGVRRVLYGLAVLGFLATIAGTILFSQRQDGLSEYWMSYDSVTVLCMAAGLLTFGRYELSKIQISEKAERGISYIAKLTFCVYLVHSWVLDWFLLNVVGISAQFAPAWISIPAVVILVFILSALISACVNKIPGLNRFIT